VKTLGLEDALRKAEANRADAAEAASLRAAQTSDKLAEANRQLQDLSRQALAIAKQRNHPRCLEIVSATVKRGVLGGPAKLRGIETGRVFTLLQPSHTWGDHDYFPYALSDRGELYDFGFVDGMMGLANPPRWIKGLDPVHNMAQPHLEAGRALNAKMKSLAENAGCGAAGANFFQVNAKQEPTISHGEEDHRFLLGESGRLVYGTNLYSKDAEEMFGKILAGQPV
jgi:hypothetical protein